MSQWARPSLPWANVVVLPLPYNRGRIDRAEVLQIVPKIAAKFR